MSKSLSSHSPKSESELHMAHLVLSGRDLQRSAQRQRIPSNVHDMGYLLHGHLTALFGEQPLRVFHSFPATGGDTEVIGYCHQDGDTLQQQAKTFAEPLVLNSLDQLATKPMPKTWQAGRQLRFEVKVCPVVRLGSATKTLAVGSEVDAWIAARERGDATASRPDVYEQWLKARCDGIVELGRVELRQFQRQKFFRRSQGQQRKARTFERPVALLCGQLEILDGDAFAQLLARGIGRHRSFGFGMLRLKPAQER